ncbi:hypothetical protein FRC02_003446 [Tulasnella sp. 418]|nr:hypothetical protein FRC02_003446 [Tulasnella sp. 418]
MDQHEGSCEESPQKPVTLPTELLITVLELVWNRSSIRETRRTLASCALVCSSWKLVAQKLLFKDVVLPSRSSADRFLSSIRRNSELGEATKIISFGTAAVLFGSIAPQHQLQLTHEITSRCPNLYHIYIRVPTLLDLEILANVFHPQTFSTLQSLELTFDDQKRPPRGSFHVSVTVQHILQFLSQFSSISHLRLYDLGHLPSRLQSAPVPPPPSFSLYEFSLWNTSHANDHIIEVDNLDQVVDWIFGGSSDTLRILCWGIDDVFPNDRPEYLSSFLKNHGRNLISFTSMMKHQNINLLEACPLLRELRLSHMSFEAHDVRKTIPSRYLEHLELEEPGTWEKAADGRAIEEVVQWATSIPMLKQVTPRTFQGNALEPWSKFPGRLQLEFPYVRGEVVSQSHPPLVIIEILNGVA